MEIEYEATFSNIDKEEMREKLKDIGASLIYPEFLQIRTAFFLPKANEVDGGWVRLRQEQDKITLSLKVFDGDQIEDQKEIALEVEDFHTAKQFLEGIGCKQKAYQENKRELWKIGDIEITIDEWPFLEPFIEIEGKSEKEIKGVAEKLGFNYLKAIFGPVGILYNRKYNVPDFYSV